MTRLLHQIWIGPSPIPDRERAWCAEMQRMNVGWRYRLHGNELLERYAQDPYIKFMVSKGEKPAFISDRLRVLLLRDEGGLYIDADAQPVRPFNNVPVWDKDEVDFVYGARSTARKGVAVSRGISFIDNTFMASKPNGRMIGILDRLWTPEAVTGQGQAVNGGACGRAIFDNQDWTCVALGYRYIYAEQSSPETLVLHDSHNLGSWRPEHLKQLCA
jgi:glycosyl transferase-like sugar-binding protein